MRIVVAGSTGLAGSAIAKELGSAGFEVVGISRSVVNLLDEKNTLQFMQDVRPQMVIDAAAKVGGIGANNSIPVDFLVQNVQIQQNLMLASHISKVEKFIFLGSSCIYPRDSQQPIKEEYLMTGPLEYTNSSYAVAKISGIELLNAYRRQYGHKWISLMPANLYGPRDNFELESSHVLPALIRRFIEATEESLSAVTLWGDGSPVREFLHVNDLASAIVVAAERYDEQMHLNVGSGFEITIKNLASQIANLSGFTGQIYWNSKKPNGTPRKILDSTRMRSLGWEPKISLESGISSTIEWYRAAVLNGEVRK
jgi:GDP-L-fucose synthase